MGVFIRELVLPYYSKISFANDFNKKIITHMPFEVGCLDTDHSTATRLSILYTKRIKVRRGSST